MTEDTSAEEVEQDQDEEVESSGLQKGDFVTIDYNARTVEEGHLVDTTRPEVAEEEGVGEDQEFSPQTIVLGEEHIFPQVEDEISGSEIGDEGSVVVPAPDAFGEYDEEQVRTVSANKIPEDDRFPGANVTIDGDSGHLETIIGGRARVDFNHPLAGDDIEYDYEIVETVDDRHSQAETLLETMLGMDLDVWFETEIEEQEQVVEDEDEENVDEDEDQESEPETETVEVEKETLYIESTPQLSMNQHWMVQKNQIAQQLVDLLDVDRVIVQETLTEGDGMMGGMMGAMGGGGGMGDVEDIQDSVEDFDVDVDAEDLAEELESEE